MSVMLERRAQALRNPDLAAILVSRCIRDEDGCLIWQGAQNGGGYGLYNSNSVHILWWILHYGPVPEGDVLAHSCHKKRCLIHARPTTQADNVKETAALKTHCNRGHLYDEANTALREGVRFCRECERTYWKRRYEAEQCQKS